MLVYFVCHSGREISLKGVGWVGEDTAGVGSVGGDSHVSVVSPRWAPGVLDEEEVLSVEGSVSNSEDTVVELGSAGSSRNDTGVVHLEDSLVGLDGNGDWLDVDGSLELGDAHVLDILVGSDGSNTLR